MLEPPDEPARWADLVARMKAFNVTRYWVEGPPDGPITFRCAIPLAGGNAVTHHFEAQGADLADAADAALNRIALWRASEPAEPPQK
ncbi:MAG: hypothetical protein KatS3mg108_0225 [Isosphaeraceae bacterium]|nr:MAG: hypothetical protein KatS3mg108_0225 [Isosphaeraceae bacterium]